MKALSIKQPWAWLICKGYKDVENRDWGLASKGFNVPQRIYVHAGKAFDSPKGTVNSFIWDRVSPKIWAEYKYVALEFGAIIGAVTITGYALPFDSKWFVGKYGFSLKDPELFDHPIPYRGQLGFFEVKLP